MSGSYDRLIDPRDLLEMLRQHPLTAPFNLAFYWESQTREELTRSIDTVCSPAGKKTGCGESCYRIWEECISSAMETKHPQVRICTQGFLCFAIPLTKGKELPDCLLGGGVLEYNFSGVRNDNLKDSSSLAEPLIESSSFPQPIRLPDAESVTEEIVLALPHLFNKQVHALSLSRMTKRLEAVQKLSRDLADCENVEQAVEIVSEALVVLFNLPRVMIVLQNSVKTMTIHSTLGLKPDSFQVDQKRLSEYLGNTTGPLRELTKGEIGDFFPGLDTRSACLFPLTSTETCLGTIVVLDIDLHSRDQALIELLINSLTMRLSALNTAEKNRQERQFSTRLVSMISSLSLVSSREELYKQILDMSAELLTATSGSFMLLNEDDGTLKIEAALGMTPSLAKTMTVAFGEGIAGKVAKSGFPML
ncbi:MAG: hypothetical protein GWO23_18080, partial [Gammaproteobacteria bacterium]|nr:hypothetical protein [Gammaproteobacteria bacterium]